MNRRPGSLVQLIELVQAQVVRAAFHVGGRERDAERLAQRRDVLEENLFLEILGAGRNQHAFALEDGGHEIGERLAGSGPGLREQHAALLEHLGDSGRHLDLAGASFEGRHRARERATGREHVGTASA